MPAAKTRKVVLLAVTVLVAGLGTRVTLVGWVRITQGTCTVR